MKVTRRFTSAGQDVYSTVEWAQRTSRISNSDGSTVFEMKDAEVPKQWSQLATDIMVSKYFRKAGVPQENVENSTSRKVEKAGANEPRTTNNEPARTGPEKSVRQVVHRLAGCWKHWGETHGYFDTAEDAQAFYDELSHMLLNQMAAPNSPQWFNTGLNWAYGISGPPQGHFIADPETGAVSLANDAYTHPQPHACFIQAVRDDLVGEGGIMDLWTREARLFKYGSGTGTNFSHIRGENEPLSGGGTSSGLMSWLRIGDRAAGAIKSGGTTRRAAKMVCLDADHPDIEAFVNWKVREELKVAALCEGIKHLSGDQKELAASLGLKLTYDFNGEAYYTVSGQNSNNSVRLTDTFFKAVDADGDWNLTRRTDGVVCKTLKAKKLWEQICRAAWRCADPGVQYDTTINDWHTCPHSGRINASNPCVTGDTLVATSTGWRRIDSLVGKSAEIINGNGEKVFIDRIFKTGTKDVYELKTRGGYSVKVTADHRVKTANRGDVPACELTVDDVLLLEQPGFGDDFVPEAFGELLGAALGDGCITQSNEQDFLFVSLGENEAGVANRLQANLNECKRWLHAGDDRGLRNTDVVTTHTGLRVGTSVAALITKLRLFAVLDAGSHAKAMGDEVYRLDRRSVAAILRGLFTTDGTVANYGEKSQYVALDSTSHRLLQQVQMLLLGFGIKSKLYANRRAIGQTSDMLPDGKGGTREYPVRQMHSLRISRSSRVVFEQEIGFLAESHKAAKLAELNRTVDTYRESMTDRVASLSHCGVEDVFDLTEPRSHHFVANGIVVHNCSEYMFLDDTACNLASINLMKFYDADARRFDVAGYEHAINLWTIVLEISVLMAAFPSEEIARQSYRFRTLGLGYANLGAMLMQAGIPYDSDEARAVCGVITSILTGRSYAMSAQMAGELVPFPSYAKNREHMMRVIRNHRRAAYGVPRESDAYENLSIKPVPIDHELFKHSHLNIANSRELLERATKSWDDAMEIGGRNGFRNAQVTVIAPTGTIGLLMDCDTTGVEPDFALVKFKKLAGGGYFKIANESLRPALESLGYNERQTDAIMTYVMGTLSVDTTLPESMRAHGKTLRDFLTAKGYTSAELVQVENALPTVFELNFAFSAWSMPEHVMLGLGIDPATARNDKSFNGLKALGLTGKQIDELNRIVCGTQTVEGAPELKTEHLPVFDCANRCGNIGQRFIASQGHIRMMAAAQPFISGAISKTINLPNEATVDDIAESYWLSWELGLKANALYRDGSKLSQPLNTKSESQADDDASDADEIEAALGEVSTEVAEAASAISTSLTSSAAMGIATLAGGTSERAREHAMEPTYVERIVERIIERPMRRRLPDTRHSLTHHFNVAGHEGYLTVGMYDDHTPGELFITMSKEGSTIGGLMDSLGTAISVALQYGVPVESLVTKFAHQRFEPMGMTTNRDIPFAKSLVDYIFRWMGMEFIPGYRDANAPARPPVKKVEAVAPAADTVKDDTQWSEIETGLEGSRSSVTANAGTNRLANAGAKPLEADDTARIDALSPRTRLAPPSSLGDGSSHGSSPSGAAVIVHTHSEKTMQVTSDVTAVMVANPLNQSNASMMGDAPACDKCGSITIRNGTCYRCMNCGQSMGCG